MSIFMSPIRPDRRHGLRGIIFDLDGTLVDSKLDFEAIRRDMGLPTQTPILEALELIPSSPRKDQMLHVLRMHELHAAENAELFDGVAEFLRWIDGHQIPRGILTRNSRESTEIAMDRLQLRFHSVLTREDAPPKPDPAGLLAICAEWRLPPADVVFCGDYLFDLQAGARAGMRTILFAPLDVPDYAPQADFVLREFRTATELIGQAFQLGSAT
jgi:HAD superfamily hydrolase (TIGR01549 family)